MKRVTLQVGSFAVNCSLLELDGKVVVVDPGQEPDRIVAALGERGWTPRAILLTHGHFDHINGVKGLLAKWPDLAVGVTDADALVMANPLNTYPPEYAPVTGVKTTPPEAVLAAFDPSACVLATPGHTPGGVSYYFPGAKALFPGDTLFAGSVGRTDLPGGDWLTLGASLETLAALPDDTEVFPGHGMFTTIGREKRGNPYLAK